MSQKVYKVWNDPGKLPDYHYHMQNKLRRDWPLLAQALDEMEPETTTLTVEGNKATFTQHKTHNTKE